MTVFIPISFRYGCQQASRTFLGIAALRWWNELFNTGIEWTGLSRLKLTQDEDAVTCVSKLACEGIGTETLWLFLPLREPTDTGGLWEILCPPARRGTGYSREGGISDDKDAANVPASLRLKPVPHEHAVICGSKLACEDIGSATENLRLFLPLREQARSHGHRYVYLQTAWALSSECRPDQARLPQRGCCPRT